MKIDDIFLMLRQYEAKTGRPATKIICGETVFKTLKQEAVDDWDAGRYLEPNYQDGCVARFMGIPVQVIHDPKNDPNGDNIYIVSDPVEDPCMPVGIPRLDGHIHRNRLIVDDIIERISPLSFSYSPHAFYGDWISQNITIEPKDEPDEVNEADLLSILNGGGYQAIQNTNND